MQTEGLVDEVISVLRAEFECAESLQATSAEMQLLIDEEKLEQVQERLMSRGEIIDLLSSLDLKLSSLLDGRQSESDIDNWDEVLDLAKKPRELMASIVSMDRVSQAKLSQNCNEIECKLKELQDGRKIVKRYGQYFNDESRPLCNA
jgi:hypothetical protein